MMKLISSLMLLFALLMQTAAVADDLPKVDYNSLDDLIPIRKDIRHGKFENGLEYFILKNNKPENRVSLRLPVRIGSVDETDKEQGMAHFVEHMCFNGTEDFPKSELVDFLEKNGVKFGAHLNAYTAFDETVYMLELPSDNEHILETGVKILENWAHKVTFADKDIDDERGVIVEEARLRGGVQMRVFEQHKDVAFYNSKYKERIPIGDTSLLRTAPHKDFREFYKKWYRPDLMSVIIVGDVDLDKMESYVKKYFSKIPVPEKAPTPAQYNLPENLEPLYSVVTDKEMQFPTVSMTYRRPASDQKGTFREYRTTIIDQIALGAMNERLAMKSLESDPPYQFAQAGYRTNMGATDFDLIAIGKGTEYKKATDALLSEAKRTSEFGITESELGRMKDNILSSYKQGYSEINNAESSDLANEIVRHFLVDEPVPGIAYEYAFVKQILPNITLAEINSRLKTYIDDNNYIATISLPASSKDVPTAEDFASNYKEVMGSKMVAFEEVNLDQPLFDKNVTPGKIVKKEKLPYDIVKLELSNGAKVYYKDTDFKDDEIIFKAVSNGGTSVMNDAEYVSGRFSDDIIRSSGVADFDLMTLRKMTSSKQYSLAPFVGSITEGFRGRSNTEDFEEMLQLMHLYFTEPRIDNESYQSWLVKQKDAVKNSERNPVSVFIDSISYYLSGYNARTKPITEDYFAKVKMNAAYDSYKNRFSNAGDFSFIFTGNIDNVKFEELVTKYIASLPSNGKNEKWKDLGIKRPKGTVKKEYKKGIDKNSTVVLLYTSDNFDYKPENVHKLNSLASVMEIRLREKLREEKGGVYTVDVSADCDKYPRSMCDISVNFSCDPNRVDELIEDTKTIVKEMKSELISDENMKKIKETQRRDLELEQKENGAWNNWIYNSIWLNEDLSTIGKQSEIIEKLSKDDIKATANKYLESYELKQFVLSPEDTN